VLLPVPLAPTTGATHRRSRRTPAVRAVALVSAVLLASPLVVPSAPVEASVGGLTDCRFSGAQVFDVQWSISGDTLNVSGMTRPYASFEPGFFVQPSIAETDTFEFFANEAAVGFRQRDADGQILNTLHLDGSFRAIGPDFIFYTGNDFFGTLITSGQGFADGSSATLAVTAQNVAKDVALQYSSCADVPLVAGQTRASLEEQSGPTITAPGAPTIDAVTAGDASLTIAFTVPDSDGGDPITNYEVSLDGGDTWTPRSPASTSSPVTLTGLTNGVAYSVGLRAVNDTGAGEPVTSGPHTPIAPIAPVTPEASIDIALTGAGTLTGTDALLVRGGELVALRSLIDPNAGPAGGVIIEDDDGTLRVTVATDAGVDPEVGLGTTGDGEIFCEICALLAAGSSVDGFIYSTPRLGGSVVVETTITDISDGECPLLRIRLSTPADGGPPIAPGSHTLQLRMTTADGLEIVALPLTISAAVVSGGVDHDTAVTEDPAAGAAGTAGAAGAAGASALSVAAEVPTAIQAGGGPVPLVPLPVSLALLVIALSMLLVERARESAWVAALAAVRSRPVGRQLAGFDELQARLEEFRRTLRNG